MNTCNHGPSRFYRSIMGKLTLVRMYQGHSTALRDWSGVLCATPETTATCPPCMDNFARWGACDFGTYTRENAYNRENTGLSRAEWLEYRVGHIVYSARNCN